uniref:Kelch-like protein 3 n=1 Tax=Cairina moschata TaxID=8855 RepID=A0A8C3BYB6_CAIMO
MKKEKVYAKGPLFALRRVKTATLGPVLQVVQQQRFRRAPIPCAAAFGLGDCGLCRRPKSRSPPLSGLSAALAKLENTQKGAAARVGKEKRRAGAALRTALLTCPLFLPARAGRGALPTAPRPPRSLLSHTAGISPPACQHSIFTTTSSSWAGGSSWPHHSPAATPELNPAEGSPRPRGSPTCSGALPQSRAGPGGAAAAPAAVVAQRRASRGRRKRRRRRRGGGGGGGGRRGLQWLRRGAPGTPRSAAARRTRPGAGRSQPCRARGAEHGRAAPWRRRGDMSESKAKKIEIKDVDGQTLRKLIDYIYTAEIEVTEENVQVLLPAASLLQLMDVRKNCCDFLQSQLHPMNCLGIRAFADVHACTELLQQANAYAEQHFPEVMLGEEFLSLSLDQVCSLISSDKLTVSSEEKVFEAVISWINYEKESRLEHMAKLMEHVRLPLLPRDYLVQTVEEEALIKNNNTCKDFLIEAMKYHLLPLDQRQLIKNPRTKPRTPVSLPKVMIVVGGQAPKAIRSVECYDFEEERWDQVAELPSRRCRAGVVFMAGNVYAVGGFNGSLRVRTVDVYDGVKDQWTSIASMQERRSTLGAAVLNDLLYAVGGFDGSTGKLYAVGGYDGASRQCLSTVEQYNPATNEWTYVADMSTRRSGAGVGVLSGLLYATGGHDGPLVRKSVEVYDPGTNAWKQVADMNMCRRNAGVCAVNGLLYVVGGDDGSCNLASVEYYNPITDKWTLLPTSMSTGRSYAGVAVIHKPL